MLTLSSILPALVVLALGLAAGAVVAVQLRRRAPVEPMRDALDDLDERVARLMNHLRELALQKGRIEAETYARERTELEAAAARAMRERDELAASWRQKATPAPVAAAASPAMRFLAERPALRGALWGGGAVAVLALLVVLVAVEQRPADSQPSSAMQPAAQQRSRERQPSQAEDLPVFLAAEAPSTDEVQGLLARLREAPSDVAAAVRLGHLLIAGRMYNEATILTDRALQLDPSHTEALVHAAALRSLQDRAAGVEALDRILARAPATAEAWLVRGMIGMQGGDEPLMQESFRKYLALAPEGAERTHVQAILSSMAGVATGATGGGTRRDGAQP